MSALYKLKVIRMHKHDKNLNKLAKKTITLLAKELGVERDVFHHDFVDGGTSSTELFWNAFWSKNPKYRDYNRIDYCFGCKKFDIYISHEGCTCC